jgi:membrane protease YdiL (CAAX protease family)
VLIGVLMVGVVFVLEYVSVALGWGIDEDVNRLTEQMLGGLMTTLPGVLTIGLAAGIGEETLMRGAVQPRLGLLLTSVVFALLHANYGITLSTLAVLIVGLALGIVRQRMNTTSAMAVHATYNIIFGLIAYFSISGM